MEEVRLVVRQRRSRVAADQCLVKVLLGWDSRWDQVPRMTVGVYKEWPWPEGIRVYIVV
jgi:hypothetical protein